MGCPAPLLGSEWHAAQAVRAGRGPLVQAKRGCAELAGGGDLELGEDPVEVVANGPVRDEQLLPDFLGWTARWPPGGRSGALAACVDPRPRAFGGGSSRRRRAVPGGLFRPARGRQGRRRCLVLTAGGRASLRLAAGGVAICRTTAACGPGSRARRPGPRRGPPARGLRP